MEKKELLERLEKLIEKGARLTATAEPVAPRSRQMRVNDALFYGWKARCISFIEKYFPSSTYLQHFDSFVQSTLLPSTQRGLEILKELMEDIEQGDLDDYISTKKQVEPEADNYVGEGRIKELANLPKDKFDTAKLVKLCEELNENYKWKNYFAVGALLRMVLDHIPPIFGKENFKQVANNYSWETSHKKRMLRLQRAARDIVDNLLHEQIKKVEVLPEKEQVDFRQELAVLLGEIITILKS